jgi:hypothetical protein
LAVAVLISRTTASSAGLERLRLFEMLKEAQPTQPRWLLVVREWR